MTELSDEEKNAILRIDERVAKISELLDRMSSATPRQVSLNTQENAITSDASPSAIQFTREQPPIEKSRYTRPPLPDPRLVRWILQQRQNRSRFFDSELFGDPAWDMLLDLTAARVEHTRVAVTSLCIASGVPPTTALRWIAVMTEAGLVERVEDEADRRRAFITLSDKAAEAMARYFAQLGGHARHLI